MGTGWWLLICVAVLVIGYFVGYFVRSYTIGVTLNVVGDLHILDDGTIYLATNNEQVKSLKDKSYVIFQVYHDYGEKIAEKTGAITE